MIFYAYNQTTNLVFWFVKGEGGRGKGRARRILQPKIEHQNVQTTTGEGGAVDGPNVNWQKKEERNVTRENPKPSLWASVYMQSALRKRDTELPAGALALRFFLAFSCSSLYIHLPKKHWSSDLPKETEERGRCQPKRKNGGIKWRKTKRNYKFKTHSIVNSRANRNTKNKKTKTKKRTKQEQTFRDETCVKVVFWTWGRRSTKTPEGSFVQRLHSSNYMFTCCDLDFWFVRGSGGGSRGGGNPDGKIQESCK